MQAVNSACKIQLAMSFGQVAQSMHRVGLFGQRNSPGAEIT